MYVIKLIKLRMTYFWNTSRLISYYIWLGCIQSTWSNNVIHSSIYSYVSSSCDFTFQSHVALLVHNSFIMQTSCAQYVWLYMAILYMKTIMFVWMFICDDHNVCVYIYINYHSLATFMFRMAMLLHHNTYKPNHIMTMMARFIYSLSLSLIWS